MDFDLTDDQSILKDSLTRLLADEYDFEKRRKHRGGEAGFSDAMWAQFAEMGLLMAPFAEDDGGLGLGAVETMVIMEAFGHALVIEPYLATVVLAGGVLRHAASTDQKAALVPEIGAGALRLALAHAERTARYELAHVETRARKDGDGYVLDGAKTLVLHGDSAHKLIVSARLDGAARDRDGLALFLVDADAPGLTRMGYDTQDGMRAAEVTLEGVRVPADALIGAEGSALSVIARVVDEAMAALCAEAVGAMDEALALTLEHVKTRKQFGASLGSFQVMQHRAAEVLVQIELARSMALLSTFMAASDDAAERHASILAAKVQIGRSARFVGQQAIQMFGGVGVTDEYKVAHLFKRLTMIDKAFGDADHHLKALAENVG